MSMRMTRAAGRVVDEAYRILTEVPEGLKVSYRTVYRWTQARESATYESGRELRVGGYYRGTPLGLLKDSGHWEGS
jgi:hypothetical protein